MNLSRKELILKEIVEYFIKNAQPVGSKTLIEEYHLPYSSATIRNDMAALEEEGYIEKTHSSSGRVPSAKGYKYYCEHLRDGDIDERLKYSLQQVLTEKTQSIQETIKKSCEILSHMTSLVSVFLGPDETQECLMNVQAIKVNEKTITVIFVTNSGYVENKTFIVPDDISADEMVDCMKLLNDRLTGTPVNDLVEKTESLKPVLSDYIINHDVIYQALLQTFVRFASDRLSFYGREELFNQPEFKNDVEKLQKVLDLLDNANILHEIDSDDDEINVNIGDIKDNPDVSVVTAKISIGNGNSSTIALIGPTRMDYDKALSALEYMTSALNEYFETDKKGE